jgi:hypothetical protein
MYTRQCTPDRPRYSRHGIGPFRAVIFGLVVALGAPLRGTSWAQPVGSEFQVNTYTTSGQGSPAVGPDGAGGFVAVWSSDGSSGTDTHFPSIQGQRFDSAGALVGSQFQVNTYTYGGQYAPAVGPDGAGGFVVAWHSAGSSGTDTGVPTTHRESIQAQRFDSTGAPVGNEFQVNTWTTGGQVLPAVGPDGAGGFVVVWDNASSVDEFFSIEGQRYSSTGAPVGGQFEVNTVTAYVQSDPAVAPDGAGGFVVVWTSTLGSGSDSDFSGAIEGQRFASTGAPIGSEFQVNTYTTGVQSYPAVESDGTGGFVVVWTSSDSSGTDTGSRSIQGQRYTSAGAPVGSEFQVNTYTPNDQVFPAVEPDGAGGFVVVWQSDVSSGTDTSYSSVQGQRYRSTGVKAGGQFQVNTYTTGSQLQPVVGADGAGGFVVAWTSGGSSGSDTSVSSVQAQRYAPTPPPIPVLSSWGGGLLAALLMLPMIWDFRRRLARR